MQKINITDVTGLTSTLVVATTSTDGFLSAADKTKLDGIAAGATANSSNATLLARANHTGEQAISTVTGLQAALDGKQAAGSYSVSSHVHAAATTSVDGFLSAADKTKLNGIATGATANSSDATLLARVNHTGVQAISTVTGLQTALDAKSASAAPTFTGNVLFTTGGTYAEPAAIAGVLSFDSTGGDFTISSRSNGGNTAMSFRTSSGGTGAERMRITATGDVGIGGTPAQKFAVNVGREQVFGVDTLGYVTMPHADGSGFSVLKAASGRGLRFMSNTTTLFSLPTSTASTVNLPYAALQIGDSSSVGYSIYFNSIGGSDLNLRAGDGDISRTADVIVSVKNNVEVARFTDTGNVGIGTATPLALLNISGARSAAAWTTTGLGLAVDASTYTDTTTAAAGTVATRAGHSFGTTTLASTNAITVTNAATVYIAGSATAGTNTTITNRYGLWNAGTTQLAGNVAIGGTAVDANILLTANANATDPTATVVGGNFQRNVVLTANNSQSAIGGSFVAAPNGSAFNYTGTFTGGYFAAQGGATTTKTVSNMHGGQFLVYHTTAGTNTNAIAGKFEIQNLNAAGVITNAYGAKVDLLFNSGIITNTYGVYIGDVTGGTQTNLAYGLYQEDTAARNFFGGNVGIGVSPSAKLHIVDGGTGSNVTVNLNSRITVTGDGVLRWGSAANNGIMSWDTNLALIGGQASSDLALWANGSEKVRVKTDGSVGIGTTAPVAKLHTHLTTGQFAVFGSQGLNITAGNFAGIGLGYTEASRAFQKSAIVQAQIGDGAARGTIHILNNGGADNTAATLADARMSITYAGDVGVNIATPGAKFHVKGSNANSVRVDNGGEQYTSLDFYNNNSSRSTIYYDNTNSEFVVRTAVSAALGFDTNLTRRMTISSAGAVTFTGSVTLASDPSSALQAATKQYVDNSIQGLSAKAAVHVATTANITLSGTQTIDGVAVIANDRVLVKNQTSTLQNGIYVCAAGAWARAVDASTWAELVSAYVFVEEGTTQGDTGWTCTVNAGGTLETTAVTWVQFSGSATFTASTGITKSGIDFQLTGQALALHNLATNGAIHRTGASTYASRTLTAPAAGITVSNGDGVSGNPTLVLANDLAAVEGLATTGFVRRTGTDTWSASAIANGDLPTSGVTASTYRSVTVNAQGIVTAGTNPTTLAGYGITDAFSPTAGGTISGNVTFTGGVASNSAYPYYSMYDSDGTANNRYSALAQNGDQLHLLLINDAWASSQSALTISRSGVQATTANFNLSTALQVNGNKVVHAGDFSNTNSGGGVAADTLAKNGISYVGSMSLLGQTDGALYSQVYDSTWQHQIFGDYRTGQIALRGKNSNSWQAWRIVWDNGNDGSGSGLDADLLDGNHASAFALKSGDTIGTTTMAAANSAQGLLLKSGSATGTWLAYYSDAAAQSTRSGYVGYGGSSSPHFHIYNERSTGNIELYTTGGGALRINSSTIWHAGNDGAGSTLDADLLDGQHGSYYANLGANTFTGQQWVNVGGTSILAGSGNGYVMMGQRQSATESVALVGVGYSSIGLQLGYGVKTSPSSTGFVSSYSGTLGRSIIDVAGDIRFFTASAQAVTVDTAITMTERMRVDAAGAVLINTASQMAGVTSAKLTVVQTAGTGDWAAVVKGGTTASQSYGVLVEAGTNSSDYSMLLRNSSSAALLTVRGNGEIVASNIIKSTNGLADYGIPAGATYSSRYVSPGGGTYTTGTASITGAIKIRLPNLHSNAMFRMRVEIFNYSTGTAETFVISGYPYNATWANVSAEQYTDSGTVKKSVRFGNDGTKNCVWIGEVGQVWAYPQVFITEFNMGYSGYTSGWDGGWEISFATAFDTVNVTRAAAYHWNSSNDGTGTGLDADLLDGQEGTYYRSATNINAGTLSDSYLPTTMAGKTFSSRVTVALGGGEGVRIANDAAYYSWYNTANSSRNGYIQHSGSTITLANEVTNSNINLTTTGTGTVRINANTAWHAGNDGAGSGLDADLLDGYQTSTACEVANTILVRDSNGYMNQRVIRNTSGSVTDGMYIGYGNAGSGATRVYGGGSTNAGLYVNASNAAWFDGTAQQTLWYNGGIPVGVWQASADAVQRFHFSSGSHSFYKTAAAHIFYNSADATRMTLDASGNLTCAGDITAYSSDARLKTNVKPIQNPLEKIASIGGYTFDWNRELTEKEGFVPYQYEDEHGFIAQEIEKIMPDAVRPAPFSDKYLTVKYERLVPLAIEGIKELSAKNSALEAKIADLESKLDRILGMLEQKV
jgi:hypothetical protein